jgi:ribosomal protein S6--L-glutamate ligase
MRIAVLASDPELYSNKRLMEAGEQRGHKMSFIAIKTATWILQRASRKSITAGGKFWSGLMR